VSTCEQPTWSGKACAAKAKYAFRADGSGQKVCGRHLNAAGAGMPYVVLGEDAPVCESCGHSPANGAPPEVRYWSDRGAVLCEACHDTDDWPPTEPDAVLIDTRPTP
jgi:hypothetical protein